MRVREPRSRLGLELVAGEVLGLERESVGEIRLEVGGALARNPVDEVERDVVESGITQSVHRPPDVVRSGNALEDLSSVGRNDWAPTETLFTPCSRSSVANEGVTVSGFASTVSSRDVREAASTRRKRRRLGEGRRAAADEDRLDIAGEPPALAARARRAERRRTPRARPAGRRP